MTIEQRLELIHAGYTKAEIQAFETGADPAPEPKQDPEPAPEPKKDPDPAKETPADPAKPTQADPEKKDDSAVLNAINNLTKAIQAQNMQMISLNTPGNITAEQALAQGVFGNE